MNAQHPLPDLPEELAQLLYEDEAPVDYSLHIPGRIMQMVDLTLAERALLAIVDSLHHNGKGCYATNAWLAERVTVSDREIRRLIDSLETKGLIHVVHYREPRRAGGRIRYLVPDRQLSLPMEPPRESPDKTSTPDGQIVQRSGQIVHTQRTDCPKVRTDRPEAGDNTSGNPGLVRACLGVLSEIVTERRSDPRACAREDEKPPDEKPLAADSSRAKEERRPSPGAELLMRPVEDGGAGFQGREEAERLAALRPVEELSHWIRRAGEIGARSVSGFIRAGILRGDAPPESYLRAEKRAYQEALSGGPLAGIMAPPPTRMSRDRENVGAYVLPERDGWHPAMPWTREEYRQRQEERRQARGAPR